jgi:hypothetical protein
MGFMNTLRQSFNSASRPSRNFDRRRLRGDARTRRQMLGDVKRSTPNSVRRVRNTIRFFKKECKRYKY